MVTGSEVIGQLLLRERSAVYLLEHVQRFLVHAHSGTLKGNQRKALTLQVFAVHLDCQLAALQQHCHGGIIDKRLVTAKEFHTDVEALHVGGGLLQLLFQRRDISLVGINIFLRVGYIIIQLLVQIIQIGLLSTRPDQGKEDDEERKKSFHEYFA
jgi:hypothetical protein